ncbi:MAG: hypothetical protein LUB61_04790, partial [Eggerthellaceae bacterium]|nr:hypothetical protein [Eggerthellaceae bacterium]
NLPANDEEIEASLGYVRSNEYADRDVFAYQGSADELRVYGSIGDGEPSWYALSSEGYITGQITEIPVAWNGYFNPDAAGVYVLEAAIDDKAYSYDGQMPDATVTVKDGNSKSMRLISTYAGLYGLGPYYGNQYQEDSDYWIDTLQMKKYLNENYSGANFSESGQSNEFIFLKDGNINPSGQNETDINGQKYIQQGDSRFYILNGSDYSDANPSTWNSLRALTLKASSIKLTDSISYTSNSGYNLFSVDVTDLVNDSNYSKWYDGDPEFGAYTIDNPGSITFTSCIEGDGRQCDIIFNIDELVLYGSHASEITDYESTFHQGVDSEGTHYSYSFGYLANSTLNVGSPSDSKNFSEDVNNYWFPCNQDITMTVSIVYHDTDDVVSEQFLQGASDIDIFRLYSEQDSLYGTYGSFAETFWALNGFNGTYYVYDTNRENIWLSEDENALAIQASYPYQNLTGDDSYTLGSIYCLTDNGSWQVEYSDGDGTTSGCLTFVEIYELLSSDVTIQKVDSSGNPISGAQFYLMKTGDDGEQAFYTYDAAASSAEWVDFESATILTTGSDGKLMADEGNGIALTGLKQGEYTLIEYSVSNEYAPVVTSFSIDISGKIQTEDPYAIVSGDGLFMSIADPDVAGLRAKKVDSLTGVALEGAAFTLSKTVSGNAGATVLYLTSTDADRYGWTLSSEDAVRLETDAEGMIDLGFLTEGSYTLYEVQAPSGYSLSALPISFGVVKNNGDALEIELSEDLSLSSNASVSNDGIPVITISNDVNTYSLTVEKKDILTQQSLDGASFSLYYVSSSETYCYCLEDGQPCWKTSSTSASELTTVEGSFELSSLRPTGEGYYRLDETASPEGYIMSDECICFTVSDNGCFELLQETSSASFTTDESGLFMLDIYNSPSYELNIV